MKKLRVTALRHDNNGSLSPLPLKKLQANINADLHHRFKSCCFLQGKDMKEVLSELIEAWLLVNGK